MKSDTSNQIVSIFSKIANAFNWITSKLFGLAFLLGGLLLFLGFLYGSGVESYRQLTWPQTTATIDSISSNSSGSKLVLFLMVNEKDGGFRSVKMPYSVSQSMESDSYNKPYFIFEGANISVLSRPSDPTDLIIAQPIWGFLIGTIMGAVFIVIGYLQVNKKANARFNEWNKDWRLWWTMFLLAGLGCFIMAFFVSDPSPEDAIQSRWIISLIIIVIGLPLFLIGGYKLKEIYKGKANTWELTEE